MTNNATCFQSPSCCDLELFCKGESCAWLLLSDREVLKGVHQGSRKAANALQATFAEYGWAEFEVNECSFVSREGHDICSTHSLHSKCRTLVLVRENPQSSRICFFMFVNRMHAGRKACIAVGVLVAGELLVIPHNTREHYTHDNHLWKCRIVSRRRVDAIQL